MSKIFEGMRAGERAQALYMDVVEQLIPAIHLHYERLRWAAKLFADPEVDETTLSVLRITLIAESGAIIGAVERPRKVVGRLRGDPDIRLAKRAFEASISKIKAARHHLEHPDTAIPKIADTGEAALGSISWWSINEDGSQSSIEQLSSELFTVDANLSITARLVSVSSQQMLTKHVQSCGDKASRAQRARPCFRA